MTALEETYRIEQEKWDALALSTGTTGDLVLPPGDFHDYARRTATFVGVADFVGDLHGRRVLEYGCGLGHLSVLLARSGAQVSGFDLSPRSVTVARDRALQNGVADRIELTVAPGEKLPYDDESFDVVVGKAILHHLDVERGWPELVRVVRPGGKAVFVEPMGMNPILNLVRDRVPYPHKNPRGADRPLTYREIHAWGRGFTDFRYREIQLFSMLERGLGFGKRLGLLRRLDDVVLERMPYLRRHCRYVVMTMVK